LLDSQMIEECIIRWRYIVWYLLY